jgi:hypothetical protein
VGKVRVFSQGQATNRRSRRTTAWPGGKKEERERERESKGSGFTRAPGGPEFRSAGGRDEDTEEIYGKKIEEIRGNEELAGIDRCPEDNMAYWPGRYSMCRD